MRLIIFLFVSAAIALISCDSSTQSKSSTIDKVIYDVVFRDNIAGSYEKYAEGASSFNYDYTYNDRGRGPKISEQITRNDKGFITALTIEGHNYRNASVSESFSSNGSSAEWSNLMDTNSGAFDGSSLYFRHTGSPAIFEILAQQLIKSDDRTLSLYPEGKVELVKTLPFELSNGLKTDLLMIRGLDVDPIYVWMSDNSMICKITKNLHVVRKDLADLRPEMKKIQDDVEDKNLAASADELSHKVGNLVIQDVNVFQKDGKILRNQDVIVEGQIIKSIHPSGHTAIDKDALLISGQGKTLLPGLFDMHTHNDKFRGLMHLAGGITSVRDLANNKQLKELAEQFNTNELLGPRIVTFCGIIDGPGKYANQRNVVNNLEEGIEEIIDYNRLGYEQIKLYSSIKPEWVKDMTAKAHELGMRVSGHIPAYMTATQAIDQGYNEIQHINMLFLNFLSDTIDTRTPLRFTMPAQHGADLDLQSEEYLSFVDLLKTNDILIDPTAAIFENMFISEKGVASPTYEKIIERFPLMGQRGFYAGGLPKDGEKKQRYRASFDKMLAVIADLYNKGVDIVPGTDGLPGFLYHRELELYVAAGIPAHEVLKLATIKSAEITGVDADFGSVEIGKQADLILVDGDPTSNISNIRRVEWTLKGGNLYYAKELYNSVGISHFK